MSSQSPPSLVRTIWLDELRRLVRDRRAFLMAVVLPVVLFPALFLLMPELTSMAEKNLEEEEVTLWLALDGMSGELQDELIERLDALEAPTELRREPEYDGRPWVEVDPDELDTELFEEDCDAIVVAKEDARSIDVIVHGSRTRSAEARGRVREVLDELVLEAREAGIASTLSFDPGRAFEFEVVDLAPPDDSLGLAVGKLLPLLAVFLVLSAGAFAALDAFCGERESGTLETILVQPVPSLQLAWGKFLCVATIATVAFVANALGVFGCALLGLGEFGAVEGGGLPLGRIALALFVYLPTVLFLSAVLTWISARARSFREGQNFILPLTLGVLGPAALATQDSVELDWLLGAIPIGGASLAMRDALVGSLDPLLGGWVVLCSIAFAVLALRGVAGALDAERVLSAVAVGNDTHAAVRKNRALMWGFASVLVVYVVGGWIQAWELVRGIAITLWVLVPALALLVAFDHRRRTGESIRRTLLGPGVPHPAHLVAAVLGAPFLAWLALHYFEWQQSWLPMPDTNAAEFEAGMFQLSTTWQLVLLAVSPGIFEELLFRGAILRSMGGEASPRGRRRLVAWQIVLFALVHASVHRFVATGVLGGLAAAISIRSRSTIPAILFHATYNGFVIGSRGELPDSWSLWMAGGAVLAVGLFQLAPQRSENVSPARA